MRQVGSAIGSPRPFRYADLETVLVVDDQQSVRGLICAVLRREGYQVLEANDAEEALLQSDRYSGHISLMITDINLPGMTGRQLADQFRARRPCANVVLTSGCPETRTVSTGLHTQTLPFLEKPFGPSTLARTVREVIGGTNEVAAGLRELSARQAPLALR